MNQAVTAAVRVASSDTARKLSPLASLAFAAVLVVGSSTVASVQAHGRDADTPIELSRETPPAASRSAAPIPPALQVSNGKNGAPLALIAGNPMFPLSSGGELFSWRVDAPVEAHGVQVQEIATTGFWVGRDANQRVFVTIPKSAIEKNSLEVGDLVAGQLVNVSGRVATPPDNIGSLALPPEARAKLASQDKLIVANNVRPPS